MSMIDQPSPYCTCSAGEEPVCEIKATRHCFVCGAALCEACAVPQPYEGAWVTVCGCGQELCLYALRRAEIEKRKVRQ